MTKYNKDNPFPAKIIERYILNKKSSTKKTYHLTLDLTDSHINFKAGDAIAIFPENPLEEVDALLEVLSQSGNEEITDPRSGAVMPLIHFLKAKVNLIRIPTPLLKLTGDPSLLGDENKEARSTFIANHDLIEFFKEYPPTIPLQELISYLAPLLPRFYSIASSPLVSPHTIDLLVSTFTYTHGEKERQGLGSHFLCSAAHLYETPIYTYLQPTSHFILPQDLSAPIIMVGPGTGVAPYRAFLQEREQTKATGKNWLFFGERNKETDYYYESYLSSLEKKGLLQLDLAFSRDQKEKIYVQHLLEKRGSDLWKLINEGSYIYICGDARHMAKDVTSAISSIIETHGNEDPKAYLKMLRQEKRLLLDVY